MAIILSQITVGDHRIMVVDSAPNLGAGITAPIGSMLIVEGQDAVWLKTGSNNTDWKISTVDKEALFLRLDNIESDIAAEETRAMAAEALLQAAVEAEALARQGDVESLQSQISAIDAVNDQDLQDEISRAQAAEAALQSNIDAEALARSSADSELDSRITSLESNTQVGLDQEILDRQAADAQLQSNIDDEAAARQLADSELDNRLSTVESELSQEILDRQSGDSNTLTSAQVYTDQKVADLVNSAPAVLDTLKELSDALGGDENFAVTVAGQIGEVDARVDQEILDRQSVDSTLQSSIDAEEARALLAESSLQSQISQEILDRQSADALKEDSINKSTDANLGDSNILFPTQKAVKDHVLNKESSLVRKLLTGKEIETLLPATTNVETADRHYSGGITHALNSDYVCYFTDQSLVFVDARNPFAVNIYKTITINTASNNFPQTITAVGNYLFMAMANGRLYTIDWTDIENPSIFGYVVIGSGQHFDVATDGQNTLFLANTTNNRVYIVDITTKTAPTLITSLVLGGFGTGVAFNNGYLYVTNYSNKLHTITKNPSTQVWEQVSVLDTIINPNRCRIVENSRGEKLLFAMRYNGVDGVFFNISNAAAPVEVKRLVMSSAMQIYAVPFAHNDIVHVGLINGTVGGISIIDVNDPKIAGAYTPVNSDGSKKFTEMRVLVKATTKSPYFKEKSLLLATGVRVGGTSAQKTTAPIQLPVINHDSVELLARPTSSALSSAVASEAQARIDADAALDARLDILESDAATKTYVDAADQALDARLDILEGADSVEGSVAKAEKDAKDYADQKIAELVNSAPEVLDTLKELSDALGGDANFATTIAGQIGAIDDKIDQEILDRAADVDAEEARALAAEALKLDKAGDTMSGDLNMGSNDIVSVDRLGLGSATPETKFHLEENNVKFNISASSVLTSGAVNAVVASIEPAADSVELFKVMITGIDSSSKDSVVYERTVRVKNIGGTIGLGTIQSDYTSEDSSMQDANCTFIVNASNVDVRVTGINAMDITWKCVVNRMR